MPLFSRRANVAGGIVRTRVLRRDVVRVLALKASGVELRILLEPTTRPRSPSPRSPSADSVSGGVPRRRGCGAVSEAGVGVSGAAGVWGSMDAFVASVGVSGASDASLGVSGASDATSDASEARLDGMGVVSWVSARCGGGCARCRLCGR